MTTFQITSDPTGDLGSSVARQFSSGHANVTPEAIEISLGDPPAFSVTIPRSDIEDAQRAPDLERPTRGIHGSRGKWLVNASGTDLVRIKLKSPVAAHMHARTDMIEGWKEPKSRLLRAVIKRLMGPRTIKLRELTFNIDSPDEFLSELGT